MRAQPDMTDDALLMQLMHIVDERPLHCLVPVLDGIDIVDHSQIHIIAAKPCQKVFECRLHMLHVSRPHILTILPG